MHHAPSEPIIQVLVADNTHIYTHLLADALNRDSQLRVVASASRSQQLLEVARSVEIDVAVISATLDENPSRGAEVMRELRTTRPNIRGIILLDSSKREVILEAFRAGARGVFSRHASLELLCKCVRRTHEGQIWASAEQMAYAVEALAAAPNVRAVDATGVALLSKRELEVVRCLAEGLTNREIGERLGLSQHTIKNYLFRVFDKLGVSSRIELLSLTLTQPVPPSVRHDRSTSHQHIETTDIDGCQRAAEQGVPTAQVSLARMYWQGKGVAQDAVSAYMWYLVSERTSLEMSGEINSAKRKLAEQLTPEQLMEAQKRAAERLKKTSRPLPLDETRADYPHFVMG